MLARAFKAKKGKPLIGLLILLGAIALGLLVSVNTPARAATGSQANTPDFIVEYKGLTTTNSALTAYFQSPVNVQAKWLKNGIQITPSVNCPTAISNLTTDVQVKCVIAAPIATDVIRLEVSAISGQTGSVGGFGKTIGDSNWGLYLSDLVSFGNLGISSLKNAFYSSPAAFQITATLPSTVRDLSSAFQLSSANPDLSGWDTSSVTNMSFMFSQAVNFNQNIGGWNTAAVTNMNSMFSSATIFNQNIGSWNTSSVTNTRAMFNAARAFNQNIGGWNTSAVTTMSMMFAGASAFNQELTSWNVANVTDMSLMFSECSNFNNGNVAQGGAISNVTAGTKPLSWTTTSLTNTAYMFRGAKAFNQNINSWNVSKVTDFNHMFAGADTTSTVTDGLNPNNEVTFFNNGGVNDTGNGTTGSAPLWATDPPGTATGTAPIDMSYMFSGAQFFNQDINSWNTSYVTTMLQMFEGAQGFNNGDAKYSVNVSGSHNLTLATGRVTTYLGMFYNTPAFNQNLNSWDVSNASSFRYMFANSRANNTSGACNCTWFNNGNSNAAVTNNTMTWLASGSTAATVDMGSMFYNDPYFNQDISAWNVGKVTDFSYMFWGAIAFNNSQGLVAPGTKPLTWDTSSATNLSQMFYGAYKFNQNIDNWDTSKVSNFSGMFASAGVFNNGLASGSTGTMIWRANPGVVTTMSNMFNSAVAFNQKVSDWNTSAVTSMAYMFNNASKFNNGQPAGTSGGSDVTFSTANVTSFSFMFASATVFNQKVSSFDTAKVTAMDNMFNRANAFNNGQTPGGVGQNPITWNTSNVTTIASMFYTSGVSSFNQALPGWNLAKCTDYATLFAAGVSTPFNNGAAAGQASVMNWTINTSQVASTISMYQMFQGAASFNADISGWDVSGVTNMSNMLFGASSFNQNISTWNTQRVTNFANMFRNATAFNVNISDWNVTKATTLANMFDGTTNFNQNLASFQLTSLAASGLVGIFGSAATTGMSEANLEATTISWSHQTARTGFPTTGTYDAFGKSRWVSCVGYYGYVRMNAKQAMTTWATLAAAPTGCSTSTVSWYGASTGVATSQTISTSTINFTPAAATSSSGSAPRFVVLERGTTACLVNNISGVISYITAGSCTVRAYDTASLTNGDNTTYKDVTFSLPTPVAATVPTAPSITSVTGGLDKLTVAFTAPSSDGGLAVSGYKYRVAPDSTSITTASWVDATISAGSFVITSGLTRMQSYVVQIAAVNGAGQGASSAVSTAATVLGVPSAPSITSVTASGLSSLTATFTAPTSTGGAPIAGYEYQLNGDGIWHDAGRFTSVTIGSLQTPAAYTVQLRAFTGSTPNLIYGDASTASTAVTTYSVPGAPTITSVTAGLAGSLDVNFSAPSNDGGLAITGYRYTVNGGGTWINISSTTSPINISGLTPQQAYLVTLRAVNSAGAGAIRTATSATTVLGQAGAPTITSVTQGAASLTVAFTAPASDGGSAVTGYRYSIDGGSTWTDVAGTTGPITITGLTAGQSITVRLAAVTAAGPGLAAIASNATTVIDVPGTPTISWTGGIRSWFLLVTAPTNNGGSSVTGFKYRTGATSALASAATWSSKVSDTMLNAAGSGNNSTLFIQVVSVNAAGDSVAYAEASATTLSLPDVPTIVSATPSVTSISLAVTAPANNGGSAVTGYKYRVAADTNSLASASWVSTGSTTSPISITGLTSGSTYVVELAAVTAVGTGTASAISSPVTLPQVPGAVRMRAVIPAGSLTQVLFLPPLSDGGSAILRYEYRYKYATSGSPATLDNATASWSSINSATWSAWATTPTLSETVSGSDIVKTFNITGLPLSQGGIWLIAEVRAVSSAGAGPASVYRPGTTDVTFVEDGTQSGDGFIKFHYHLTYDGNSPILGYEYMLYTTATGWSGWSDMGTTSDALPYTVTGLTNGETYSVRVRARNLYGTLEGQPSFTTLSQAATPNKPMPTGALTYGNVTYSPSATLSPTTATRSGDGAISFRSQYTSICTVDSAGTISVVTAGMCLIYMDVAEGSTTRAMSFSAWANISRAAQSALTWNVPSTSGAYLTTITLALSGGSGDGVITYAKALGSTCSISGAVVTLGAVGSACTVYATKAADTNYNTIMTSANLALTSTQASQTAVTLSSSSSMDAGQTLTLKANGGSGTGAYVFSVTSQGTTGCSLNGAVLTAPSTGSCTVSVTRQSSTNYQASSAVTQVISVNPVVQSVRFTSVVPSQPISGGSYSPTGTATSGLGVQISVLSGACSIASGTVTFAASGDCVLGLDQAGNGTYSAATQVTQTIAVGLRNQALSFTAATNAILAKTYGDLAFLVEASSTEASAAITYSLSPTTANGACSVTSRGLVTVLAVGVCAIDADSASTSAFAAASRITKTITVQSDFAGVPSLGSVSGGNLSATLGFYAPGYDGGTTVTGYQVVAIDQAPGSSVQVTESACSTTSVNGLITCRVTGLENGTTYKLKVAPINEAGLGAYSVLSGPVTVATNPSAVQNLTVNEGNASLTISWGPPDSLGGGTFSAYRIFIKRSDALTYDQNHFYNVTNQSTSAITVTRESPTDGFSFAGGPVFMNGVGYDVKVVTVTTANLLELETNTAVVNQIPHTVPDAPAVATTIVLGNQLVIAWSSPLSDGGKPVSAYTVSIGNSTCALATATDLQCSTALPTAPGDYRFEVRAVNAAGFSAPTSALFHVAAIVVPPVQVPVNSGGGSTPEAPKPEIAPEVYSVALSSDGKSAAIIGKGLAKIKSLNFGSTQATVLASDEGRIVASSVGLKPGIYDLFITFNDGTTLRVEGALVVAGKPVVIARMIKFAVSGFSKGSDKLTNSKRISIERFLKANKTIKSIECIGSTEGPTVLKLDAKLAMKRGAAVCAVARKLGLRVLPISYVNRSQTGVKYRSVELRINR